MKWYVLQFTTTRYSSVVSRLCRIGLTYYCPMETTLYRRTDKILSYRVNKNPLFPGYLFILIDFNKVHSTALTSIPYVQRFISFGGQPVSVPIEIINNLIEREAPSVLSMDNTIIDREFADILLIVDPAARSIALLNYITETDRRNHDGKIRPENKRYNNKCEKNTV